MSMPRVRRKRINWNKYWENETLRQPDRILAEKLGVTRQAVQRARRLFLSKRAEEPLPPAPITVLTIGEDGAEICRDDRCDREDVHLAHFIPDNLPDPFYDVAYPYRRREVHTHTLREIVYDHTPVRRCKVFKDLYQEVIEDYGTFASYNAGCRAVWRALKRLVGEARIIHVTFAGKDIGGYVRSDSPLLRSNEGRWTLIETLKDASAQWE
jgi:hypothetical protein